MRLLFAALSLALSFNLSAAEIDQKAALAALAEPHVVLIDVRTSEEVAQGALPGAAHIQHTQISQNIASLVEDKNATIVLYCRSGRRSSMAQDALQAMGYSHVINAGGYQDLKRALKQ